MLCAMDTFVIAVADEVRANLARRRISGIQAAKRLGWDQAYMQRRLAGKVAFDVADLGALAELLHVPIASFFVDVRGASGERQGYAYHAGSRRAWTVAA